MKTGKHVIFLGAGASKGSGYPLANELRLLISSRTEWEKALEGYAKKHHVADEHLTAVGLKYWDSHSDALNLFRHGGFATIDEFCKLAGAFQFQHEINGLRGLVRAALGLFNPEEQFEKSEYYGFVQALFKEDLFSLREDVTVLTYNYDPYFEFLIYRALEHRWRIRQRGKSCVSNPADRAAEARHDENLNAVTSGLASFENQSWLASPASGFCVLKLHGSIGFVSAGGADFSVLFSGDAQQRANTLFEGASSRLLAPVVFPWEVMTEGGFVEEKLFPLQTPRSLYGLFRGIWERAKREVQAADKISFVGLSMHSFLLDGLKYLFEGKEGKTEVVVANPDKADFVGGKRERHWSRYTHTAAYTVSQVLNGVAPKMKRVGVFSGESGHTDGEITLISDFSEFVKKQMKPVLL